MSRKKKLGIFHSDWFGRNLCPNNKTLINGRIEISFKPFKIVISVYKHLKC
jgi:hypothetical protein